MQASPFGIRNHHRGRLVGRDGFATFSDARASTHAPWIDISYYLQPPYSPTVTPVMRRDLRY